MYKSFEKICLYCLNTYIGNKTRKYCEYECAKKSRESKKEISCKQCNKQMLVQSYRKTSFCSKECYTLYLSSEVITLSCKNCLKVFKRKSCKIRGKNNFCIHSCSNEYNSGQNHYEWKEEIHNVRFKKELRKWSIKIKKRDGYVCVQCGETNKKKLQAHHIKERNTYPELALDLDNGITLCVLCHAQQHTNCEKTRRLILSHTNNYYETLKKK